MRPSSREPPRPPGGRPRHFSKYVKNLDQDHTAQIARAIVAPRYRAIRTGRYLLVKYSNENREMYDMSHDPLQLNSIYKNTRYFPVRKFLLKKLKDLVECKGAACNTEIGQAPEGSSEEQETPAQARAGGACPHGLSQHARE